MNKAQKSAQEAFGDGTTKRSVMHTRGMYVRRLIIFSVALVFVLIRMLYIHILLFSGLYTEFCTRNLKLFN